MISLGERMKRYEHAYRRVLPRRTYTLLRLDGRAFHTFTKGFERPFDASLMEAMDNTAAALCKGVSGAQFAYTQSDEISLLVTDFANYDTEPWMGGVEAKILSLSASLATGTFYDEALLRKWKPNSIPQFDSRLWTMSDPCEIVNYFIWRQRDCVKNSITMAAQTVYSHKELNGKNGNQRQEMLFDKGINWNDYPAGCKRGRVVNRSDSGWVANPAPHFNMEDTLRWVPELGRPNEEKAEAASQ